MKETPEYDYHDESTDGTMSLADALALADLDADLEEL